MRKLFQKYLYWFLCTVILVSLALFGLMQIQVPADDSATLRFCVETDSGTEEISAFDGADGTIYVFLPSYANLDRVTVRTGNNSIVLNDIALTDGMSCDAFTIDTDYTLTANDHTAQLRFLQSANMPTIYIDTVSGTMNKLHSDKDYRESATVTVYDQKGTLSLQDRNSSISTRGNATWYYDKKPYSLKLSAEASLLGMSAGADWVLLANATDETNLHNKLVLDLAQKTCPFWTPSAQFADVYLNGEYNGLYLLTEKVGTGANRLDISPEAGDFLCKVEIKDRWYSLNRPFLTEAGRTVEISAPENISRRELPRVIALVNAMEATILSGADLRDSAILDLDSWAHKYLIDEISANIDSDLLSSYFHYTDGVFYGGPVWDYDRSMGNSIRNENPYSFIAKTSKKADDLSSLYYSTLYKNESFYHHMTTLFQHDFLPLMQEMVNGGIAELAAELAPAANLNSIRWRNMFDRMQDQEPPMAQTVEELIQYLSERAAFLSSAWIDNVEYCTVQFEYYPGSVYRSVSIEKGTLLNSDYIEQSTVWYNAETMEVFNPDLPITEDLILITGIASESVTLSIIVTLLSLGALMFLFLCFAAVDCYRRAKERRAANESRRAKISP